MGLTMRWLFVALALAATPVMAARLSVNDQTTCQDVIRATIAGDDVTAMQRDIGRYAAFWFVRYGVPAPKDLRQFGMNVAMQCMQMQAGTPVLSAAMKVRDAWRD